jgi:hypothetical protein
MHVSRFQVELQTLERRLEGEAVPLQEARDVPLRRGIPPVVAPPSGWTGT